MAEFLTLEAVEPQKSLQQALMPLCTLPEWPVFPLPTWKSLLDLKDVQHLLIPVTESPTVLSLVLEKRIESE